MAVDRPNSSDENAETLPEQRTAEWRPPPDDPGNEPPGMSRLDSRAAARAAVEKRPQATTEAPSEDEPETLESPEESPSGRDSTPDTDADNEQDADADQSQPEEQEEEGDTPSSGWDASGYADHPDRPEPADIRLTDDRRTHIFDGEGDGRGGHRHGTGVPGKTEFPADWDDDAAVDHILDVARRPDPDSVEMQDNGRWRTEGERDGVRVRAIVRPDGRIVTAHPLPGGRGVVQNPEEP